MLPFAGQLQAQRPGRGRQHCSTDPCHGEQSLQVSAWSGSPQVSVVEDPMFTFRCHLCQVLEEGRSSGVSTRNVPQCGSACVLSPACCWVWLLRFWLCSIPVSTPRNDNNTALTTSWINSLCILLGMWLHRLPQPQALFNTRDTPPWM